MTVQSKRSRWYGKDAHRTKGNYRRTRYRDVDTDDPRLNNNWGSGVDPDFVEFTHANSELRYYFWPDIDGSVMLTSDPDGILTPRSVVFIGADGLSTEDNPDFYYDGTNLNLPEGLLVGSGTAANPPLSFIGEEDKGMYSYATGNLGFCVSGTHVVALNSTWMGGDIYFDGNGIRNDNDTDMMMTFDVGNNKIKFYDKNAASICDLNASTSTFAGDVQANGRFKFEAGTGHLGTFTHANTSARIWVFPDATGTVVLTSVTGGLLASGSVPYSSSSGMLVQDNPNFVFDGVQHFLGIGAWPDFALHVTQSGVPAAFQRTAAGNTVALRNAEAAATGNQAVLDLQAINDNSDFESCGTLKGDFQDISDGAEHGRVQLTVRASGTDRVAFEIDENANTHTWSLDNTPYMVLNKTRLDFGTTTDAVFDSATKGFVLKDTQGTPHYWRVTIDNVGALVTTDLGTSKP
jgi:hypothetical protein